MSASGQPRERVDRVGVGGLRDLAHGVTLPAPQLRCVGHHVGEREVVDRLVADPGSAEYGRLSVMTQLRSKTVRLFDVSPHAFRPVPKVFSALARFELYAKAPADIHDSADLRHLVTRCFAARRKTLRNGLKGLLSEAVIREVGVDPQARPQTLTLDEFATLANAYTASKVTHKNCG